MIKGMKPGDIYIYLFILMLVGMSFFGLYSMGRNTGEKTVVIEMDGKVLNSFHLSDGMAPQTYTADAGDDRYNIISYSPDGVDIIEANCSDKICVRWGKIINVGQTIVCLPHRVVVRIIGSVDLGEEIDDIAS